MNQVVPNCLKRGTATVPLTCQMKHLKGLAQWFTSRAILSPMGHLVTSRDIFGFHNWRLGMLLNILQRPYNTE